MLPVKGSILRCLSLCTLSSRVYSKIATKLGLMLRDDSKCTWASDCGNPSKTQPLTLQSLLFSLASITRSRISSGTSSPISWAYWILILIAGFFFASACSSYIGLTLTSPKRWLTISAVVDLPEPGGPKMITLGGLRGALILNLRFIILPRSATVCSRGLPEVSYWKMKLLNVSLTPFRFSSCSDLILW